MSIQLSAVALGNLQGAGGAAPMTETILARLFASLRSAANLSRTEQVRPAAVLWTDHDGQWRAVAERLRASSGRGISQ